MVDPLAGERSVTKVAAHIEDAVQNGARILTGGEPISGPGFFFPPTVLADMTPSMLSHREGIFGP
jgi:acyl-CoA reductase-like NAD-dependent aldehyde dehydrogenase